MGVDPGRIPAFNKRRIKGEKVDGNRQNNQYKRK